MMMLAFQPASAEWTGAAADQFISSFSSQSTVYCPALAVGPNYELYAVWAQRELGTIGIYEVYFSKSTDGGITWTGSSADRRISANDGDGIYSGGIYGARRLDIAVNSLGYIYVVWPEDYVSANFDTTQEVMMVMSMDGGTTWIHSDTDFPVSDTLTTQPVNSPSLAIDNNDNIHVIWNQNEAVTGIAEIHYSRSTDNGLTWTGRSADRYISFANGQPSYAADIDVGPDNSINLVWQESYGTYDQRILYGVSNDGGATWSCQNSDSTLAYAPYVIVFPRIKAKPFSGYVSIIYACNDTAYYVGTTNGGASWTNSTIYGGHGYDMYGPDLAVTTTGTMVAILDEDDPITWDWSSPNRQIFAKYSFDYGVTWSAGLQPVSNFDSTATFDRTYIPSVLITNTDILHCLYSTNRDPNSNSYQEMAYSRNDELGILPGAIEGTVTELDGTTPIVGVAVTLLDSLDNLVDNTTTNAQGNYEFLFGIDPGFYTVEFSIYTHHDTSVTDVEVQENQTATVDVSMRPKMPGTISGTVYEETGVYPLQGVDIEVKDQADSVWATATTNSVGHYEFTLWPQDYNLTYSVELFHDTTIYDVAIIDDGTVNLDVNMRWAIPADDIGPASIDEPVGFLIVGQPYTPTVTVENFGYQDQVFSLNFVIQDETFTEVYNETYTAATVDSLGTLQIAFGVDFAALLAGDYQFTATVINAGDENTGNDVAQTVITAYQHQSIGGPDGYGYSFRDNLAPCGPEFNWIDISTSGTQVNPTSHYFMSNELPIGFNFEFYGQIYTSMYINSHGALHIGIRDTWLMTNDCPIPDPSTPVAPMVLPWWDQKEVQFEIGQGVYYEYFDEPTVDYTVVQWNASTYGHDDTTECEVILYEDGRIVFQYNKVSPTIAGGMGQLATVGLEYDVPPDLYGLSYLCNDDNPGNRLFAGLAIEWMTDIGTPGSVSGVVTDADTDLPIENVYVEAVGAGVHDFTNSLGEYSLPGLYACDYEISFTHEGYTDTTVTGVTVTASTNTTLDVEMRVAPEGYAYLPGDANMNNGAWPPAVIGSDVTYLVNFFRGLTANPACLLDGFYASADVNASCTVIGSDVTRLVNFFRGSGVIEYCPAYEPLWHNTGELPAEPPAGWPNCNAPVMTGKIVPGDSSTK